MEEFEERVKKSVVLLVKAVFFGILNVPFWTFIFPSIDTIWLIPPHAMFCLWLINQLNIRIVPTKEKEEGS